MDISYLRSVAWLKSATIWILGGTRSWTLGDLVAAQHHYGCGHCVAARSRACLVEMYGVDHV
jgi:threonine dehydrogenase-like Zn-dependent dehydrogenase